MSTTNHDALVVGAGVIGLASAFRLTRAGWRVTVFDPSPGGGATWAAAGMIAPGAEVTPGEEENYRLQRGALAGWRELARELLEVTGETVALEATGTLLVGLDAGDRRLVDQFELVATRFGAATSHVYRDASAALFEGVTSRVSEGLFIEGDAWVDPDRAVEVLLMALQLLGTTFVHERVITASAADARVTLATAGDDFSANVGLLATGARPLPSGVAERVASVVRPVRGMTVRVQGVERASLPTVRAYVRGRPVYLVARPGGYGVLGSSSDERRELVVEVGELQRLLRDALDLLPALENSSFIETREGLRPATKDLTPFLEIVDGRWAWLSGHYRHGVTLAPLAAKEALAFAEALT